MEVSGQLHVAAALPPGKENGPEIVLRWSSEKSSNKFTFSNLIFLLFLCLCTKLNSWKLYVFHIIIISSQYWTTLGLLPSQRPAWLSHCKFSLLCLSHSYYCHFRVRTEFSGLQIYRWEGKLLMHTGLLFTLVGRPLAEHHESDHAPRSANHCSESWWNLHRFV
jgi:hypothetical protein